MNSEWITDWLAVLTDLSAQWVDVLTNQRQKKKSRMQYDHQDDEAATFLMH